MAGLEKAVKNLDVVEAAVVKKAGMDKLRQWREAEAVWLAEVGVIEQHAKMPNPYQPRKDHGE